MAQAVPSKTDAAGWSESVPPARIETPRGSEPTGPGIVPWPSPNAPAAQQGPRSSGNTVHENKRQMRASFAASARIASSRASDLGRARRLVILDGDALQGNTDCIRMPGPQIEFQNLCQSGQTHHGSKLPWPRRARQFDVARQASAGELGRDLSHRLPWKVAPLPALTAAATRPCLSWSSCHTAIRRFFLCRRGSRSPSSRQRRSTFW